MSGALTHTTQLATTHAAEPRWGADPSAWDLATWQGWGLTGDVLPVVANPHAKISPNSHLAGVGKTPSLYDRRGQVVGLAAWTQRISTEEDIEAWRSQSDYSLALQMRHARAIDVDVTDAVLAKQIADFIEARHPGLPRRQRGGSSKFLLLALVDPGADMAKRRMRVGQGTDIVEFLATGQQAVLSGTHPSGARYEWPAGFPVELPELSRTQFDALWDSLVQTFGVGDSSAGGEYKARQRGPDLEMDDPAADFIEQSDYYLRTARDRKLIVRCPFDAEHTSGGAGDTSTVYVRAGTNGYLEGRFICQHGHCSGRHTRVFLEAMGYSDPSRSAEADFGDFDDAAPAVAPSESDVHIAAAASAPAKPGRRPLLVLSPGQLRSQPQPQQLIDGLLPDAGYAVLYGPSGAGKSFAVLSMALSVARGVDWFERAVMQTGTLYLAAEGSSGMQARLEAYGKHHGCEINDEVPFWLVPEAIDLLAKDDPLRVVEAARACREPIGLVICDTLNRSMSGSENDVADMTRVIAAASWIAAQLKALVLIVTHTGKVEDAGARGHSSLRAGAEAEVFVHLDKHDKSKRLIEVTKMRDGRDDLKLSFGLEPVVIGHDEVTGDERVVPVAVQLGSSMLEPGDTRSFVRPKTYEAIVLEAMGEAFDALDLTDDHRAVPLERLVARIPEVYRRVKGSEPRERLRDMVVRAVKSLEQGQHLRRYGDDLALSTWPARGAA